MKEEGIVINECNGECLVRVRRKTACGENCASCSSKCGAREHICKAKNLVCAKSGDRVMLETDDKSVLKSAFLVYILPIAVFLGVFLLFDTGFSQVISAVAAITCAAIVFVLLHAYDKRKKDSLLPEITRVL